MAGANIRGEQKSFSARVGSTNHARGYSYFSLSASLPTLLVYLRQSEYSRRHLLDPLSIDPFAYWTHTGPAL